MLDFIKFLSDNRILKRHIGNIDNPWKLNYICMIKNVHLNCVLDRRIYSVGNIDNEKNATLSLSDIIKCYQCTVTQWNDVQIFKMNSE